MARDWRFWCVLLPSLAALALTLVNLRLQSQNLALSQDVSARQQLISQSPSLGKINEELIRTLAKVAAQSGDQEIQAMLQAQGITYTVRATEAPANDDDAVPAEDGSSDE